MIDLSKLRETVAELQRLAGEATPLPWEALYDEYSEEDDATIPAGIGIPQNPGMIVDPEDCIELLHRCGETDAKEEAANVRLTVAAVNAVPILSEALPALIAAAEAVQAWEAADSAGRKAVRDGTGLAEALTAMEAAEALMSAAAKGMREVEG
jgi:hypothetical protein